MDEILVVVSDLHIGSDYGLLPPGFHNKSGNEIGLNPLQRWLWEEWQDMWAYVHKYRDDRPFSVIVNGDVIDGFHHGTKEIWSHDESEHGIAAYFVLRDALQDAHKVFFVEGTESHTKDYEHAIAVRLDSELKNVVGCFPTLDLEMNGSFIRADHHISTTTRAYLETSALGPTLNNERINRSRHGSRIPDIVFRAHRHRFGLFDDGYGMICVTPPWQGLTRFGRRVVPDAMLQVGSVIVDWKSGKPQINKYLVNKSISSPHSV